MIPPANRKGPKYTGGVAGVSSWDAIIGSCLSRRRLAQVSVHSSKRFREHWWSDLW